MDKYNSSSRYCYPGTEVLINKFNEENQDVLDNLEIIFTTRRLYQLYNNPISGSFDLNHLQRIHKFIFSDVYSFSGEFRDEQISKGTTFAHPRYIESYGRDVMIQLKEENFLKGLDKDKFSERASYYLSEINMLHPFREGNGRTQREYFRLLAMKNGFELDWTKVDQVRMLQTSIDSVNNSDAFTLLFNEAILNDSNYS